MFVWQSEFHLRGWIKPESLIQGSLAENQIIGSMYGRERSDLLDTESLHLWINWNTLNRTSQCYTRSVIPSKKQNHQGIIKCLIGSNVLVIFRHIVKKIREQVLFLVYWICFLSLLDQLGQEWTKRCSLLKVATVARCWEKHSKGFMWGLKYVVDLDPGGESQTQWQWETVSDYCSILDLWSTPSWQRYQ